MKMIPPAGGDVVRYTIDRWIPMPPPKQMARRKTPQIVYPFRDMRVGDSFFQPAPDDPDVIRGHEQRIMSAAAHHARRHNMRFATRRVPGGLRCWRVE